MACSIELVQATEFNQDITAALEPQEKEESTKTLKQVLTKLRLTLKAPITTVAGNNFSLFFLFFRENKTWNFMWIVCLADDFTWNVKTCFLWKKKKKKNKNVVCYKFCLAL